MKKILLSLAALCCAVTISATDLWTGDHEVTWGTTLYIEAAKFADTQVGDQLKLTFRANSEFGDVIELKSDGKKLPGTCFRSFGTGDTNHEVFVTEAMLAQLKATGLEVCGNLFNATKVEVNNVGFEMPAGAIWAGWFWCDDWKTMELWKESFDGYNGERYLIVNISEEPYDYDYDFNILSTWDRGSFANGDNTTYGKTQIILDTQKLEGGLMDAIQYNDRVMFQGNCRVEGKGFNITSIVLKGDESAIEGIAGATQSSSAIYNLSGQQVGKTARGLYIMNGCKVVMN